MNNVAIYGVGKVAKHFYNNHLFKNENLVYFIETKTTRDFIYGIPVIEIGRIDSQIDKLYIANSYVDTIFQAIKQGVPKEKMVLCNESLQREYVTRNKGILDIEYYKGFADEYEEYVAWFENRPRYVLMRTMNNPIKMFACENVQTVFDNRIIVSND